MPSSASRPRRQSAKAPTPGSTMRSARYTVSGSRVTTIFSGTCHAARRALERFRRRVQIAGAVVDDGNAHREPPGSGNNPMISLRGNGGGFENGCAGNIPRRRRCAAIDRQLIVDEPRAAWRSSDRRSGARPVPGRRRPRCRAGAICAATGSSAAGWPPQIPSATPAGHRPERSPSRRRRAPPVRTSTATITTIQPISASHSRCQTSQTTPRMAAQK